MVDEDPGGEAARARASFPGMAESAFACGDHRRRHRGSVPRSRAAGARHPGGCVRAGPRADGDRRRDRAVRQLDPRVRPARAWRTASPPTPPSPPSSSTGTGRTEAGSPPTRSRGQLVREAVRRPVLRDPPRRPAEDARAARSAPSTCTSAAGWSTWSRSATRWCWSSPTAASSAPTSSSAPTACARRSAGGSPAPTTPSTPGPAPSAASCPTENLPSLPDPHAIQFWMGPDAHMLHYAIGGNGESVNFFAVVETPKIWLHPARSPRSTRSCPSRPSGAGTRPSPR